jgi:hypothetical protein
MQLLTTANREWSDWAEWLVSRITLFGIPLQNWMWVLAALFALYGAAVLFVRHS